MRLALSAVPIAFAVGLCSCAHPTTAQAPHHRVEPEPRLAWLRSALVGSWAGAFQNAPYDLWKLRLDLHADGTWDQLFERVLPDDSQLCPPLEQPFLVSGVSSAGVGVWALQSLAADGSASMRANRYAMLSELFATNNTGLRLSPELDALRFDRQVGNLPSSPRKRVLLHRVSPRPVLPAPPPGLTWAQPSDFEPPVRTGCQTIPTPDEPSLEPWPEGLRLAIPFRSVPVGSVLPIGRFALHDDVEPRMVRADTVTGECTARLANELVLVRSESTGPCTVHIWALDKTLKKRFSRVVQLTFHAVDECPPPPDWHEVRALYSLGFASVGEPSDCPPLLTTAASSDSVFPNALQVRIRGESGIRARHGRFIAALPALDGVDESRDLRALLAIVSRARRYVVVPTGLGTYPPADTSRLFSEILAGGRLTEPAGWHQVLVDVSSRAQLAAIAQALSKHPSVTCVTFVSLAVVGIRSPGDARPAPLPWPSPETLSAPDDCTTGWVPGREHRGRSRR